MRALTLTAVAMLLALPAGAAQPEPSVAANQVIVGQPDQATLNAGIRLATVLNPEDLMVAAEKRGFEEELIPALRKHEDYVALEAKYPGIIDEVAMRMRPLLEEYGRASMPQRLQQMGLFFAQRFSRVELEDMLAFYTSPTGQRLIRAMFANASMQGIVDEAIADPEQQTSIDAVNQIFASSLNALPKALIESDRPVLRELMRKPWFARIRAVAPEMRQLQQQMINEPDPAFEGRLDQVITETIENFIEQSEQSETR